MNKMLAVLLVVSIATNVAFVGNWYAAPRSQAVCESGAEAAGLGKVVRFLRDARLFHFATVDGVKPRVIPLGAALAVGGRLAIAVPADDTAAIKIAENPAAEISAAIGDGTHIRISGPLENSSAPETRREFFKQFPNLASQYEGRDDRLAIMTFINATVVIKDPTGFEETIELK